MKIRKAVVAGIGAAALAGSMSTGAFAIFDNNSNGNTTGNSTSGTATSNSNNNSTGTCTHSSTNGAGGVQVVSRSGGSCGPVTADSKFTNKNASGPAKTGSTKVSNGNHL